MDVNSGAVHVVDDVVYDAIALLKEDMPETDKPAGIPEELEKRVRNQLADEYGYGSLTGS